MNKQVKYTYTHIYTHTYIHTFIHKLEKKNKKKKHDFYTIQKNNYQKKKLNKPYIKKTQIIQRTRKKKKKNKKYKI